MSLGIIPSLKSDHTRNQRISLRFIAALKEGLVVHGLGHLVHAHAYDVVVWHNMARYRATVVTTGSCRAAVQEALKKHTVFKGVSGVISDGQFRRLRKDVEQRWCAGLLFKESLRHSLCGVLGS